MKLSLPQTELLTQLSTGPRFSSRYYPPAKKLVELGMAEWWIVPGKLNRLRLTVKGARQLVNPH